MNIEGMKYALSEVRKSCFLTNLCREEIDRFLETGNFGLFSDGSLKELSLLYPNIILPAYQFYTKDYIPNIFQKLGD